MSTDSRRGRALTPVLIYIGLVVAVIGSLGSPLVPTIANDYHVSLGTAQWAITLPLLVGAVISPVVGRLGDGPRRLPVLLAVLGVVVIGSVLVALPIQAFAMLLAGRGLQGFGLALIPLAMSVARDHLEPGHARSTLATLSVTTVVGAGLGYPISGLLAEHYSLHVGFWGAAVFALIAMALSAVVVPASSHRAREHFDLAGAIVLGLGLAALLVGISEASDWGWGSAKFLGSIAIALVLLAIWSRHELNIKRPLVDLHLMRHPTVLKANATGLLAAIGMYMLISMIIRYVQTPSSTGYGLGASVLVAGFVLLPFSVTSFFSSKLVTYLSRWISPEQMLPLGALAFTAALLVFATSRNHMWEILVAMALGGVGIGASFAVMPRMIVGAVPADQTSSALALSQVIRTAGTSIGSALAAAILTAHTLAHAEFPTNTGYTVGALVAVGLCVLTAVVSWVLPSRTASAPVGADEELLVTENVNAAIAGLLIAEDDSPGAETDPPAGHPSDSDAADGDSATEAGQQLNAARR